MKAPNFERLFRLNFLVLWLLINAGRGLAIEESLQPRGCPPPPHSVPVHFRLLRLQTEWQTTSRKWALESKENGPRGPSKGWDVIVADIDANGISDLIISDHSFRGIFIAKPLPDSTFLIESHLPSGPEHLDLIDSLRISGLPGECAEILLAPAKMKGQFQMLSGGPHPALSPIPSMIRRAENLELALADRAETDYQVVETDLGPPRHDYFWRHSRKNGWHQISEPPAAHVAIRNFLGISRDLAGLKFVSHDSMFQITSFFRVYEIQGGYLPEVFHLERSGVPYSFVTGDLDGDGANEHLFFDAPLLGRGTWISKRFPGSLYSGPIASISELITGAKRFGAGDFDGDGDEELLISDDVGFRTIEFQPKHLLGNVVPLWVNGTSIDVDDSGRATLQANIGETLVVNVNEAGLQIHDRNPRSLQVSRAHQTLGIYIETPEDRMRGNLFLSQSTPDVFFPCIGFNQTDGATQTPIWGAGHICPENHLIVETARSLESRITCCRAPLGLLRTERTIWKDLGSCPTDFAVTAMVRNDQAFKDITCPTCETNSLIRCTAINTADYEIQPSEAGQYWGPRSEWQPEIPISQLRIPLGLRAAFGRTSIKTWIGEGCVGKDWGSVLVARTGKSCEDTRFSKVLPKYHRSDAPIPRTFPIKDCLDEPNLFLPESGCQARSHPSLGKE